MVARFLFLLFIFVFCPATTTAQQRNSSSSNIPLGSSLSATNISYWWSSSSGQFAFGFYPKGNGFAVGIWYAKIRNKTQVVWTARRDDPPLPRDTKLLLTSDGRLILQNQLAQELPLVDTPLLASSASLLDSGNLVLYNSNSSIIWQSFDSPTDTLLPGQRLLAGHKLISSLSEADHSSGNFQLAMQNDGNLVLYPADVPAAPEVSYWNTATFKAGDNVSLNLNEIGGLYLLNSSAFNIMNLNEENFSTERMLYRLTIDADGLLRLYSRDLGDEIGDWRIEWLPNISKCDPKGLCGPNAHCSVKDDTAACTCFPGFDKIDQQEAGTRNLGCKRNLISSVNNCSANSVQEMENIIWVDDSYSILQVVDKDTCRDECSRDCNCEAAIYKDRQCRKQVLPLRFGMVKPPGDQGIALVKVGSGNLQTTTTTGREKKHQTELVLILSLTFLVAAILVLAISGLLIYKFRVRGYKHILSQGNSNSDGMDDDIMLRSFKYSDLEEATNGFEEEVGRGAFGTVFKGVLSKGQAKTVIAVKRLEIVVAEGEREFQNEVKIIGRTHHRNLVQLLGYCHEGTNRLLVYEYMTNGSLADFIFKSSEGKPEWEERIRIALDVARGILYMHEECKTQIIHCDIKPENILMDERGSAKIADFGVAKLLMPYQSKTRTRMRGTRGYVAPEWHKNVPVTTKVDVYSFGIMLLEIVCCRRSLNMDAEEDEVVLSEWVYDCFEANEVEKVVGGEEVERGEVERVVKVGLWCIQNEPSLRPLMKKVVLMLEGTVEIPVPPSPVSFLGSI